MSSLTTSDQYKRVQEQRLSVAPLRPFRQAASSTRCCHPPSLPCTTAWLASGALPRYLHNQDTESSEHLVVIVAHLRRMTERAGPGAELWLLSCRQRTPHAAWQPQSAAAPPGLATAVV